MSYLALYRKYRPQNFAEVVGQPHVALTLQNALKSDKIAHAYLFCGPRGVGKTTIARLLAKAVNCENLQKKGNTESCDKCDSCREIKENKAIDLIEIDAASNRGIDEIRELREKIKFTPNRLKYKIFIIDEVHMLTIEAFNALLKTLEEPPAHAIFILATTEAHKIPATILSRCQRFDFKKLTRAEIVGQLANVAKKEKVKIDEESLNLLASNAEGSSRDGLSLLNQVISLEDNKITIRETKSILGLVDLSQILEFTDYLIVGDTKKAIKLINNVFESGYNLKQFLKNLLEYFRKLLLAKIDPELLNKEDSSLTKEQLDKLKEQSQSIEARDLVSNINYFSKSRKEIDDSIIPQLPLEIAAIEATIKKGENNLLDNVRNDFQNGNKKIVKKNKDQKKLETDGGKKESVKKLDPQLLSGIRTKWNNYIAEVSKKNFTLGTFLKVCDVIDINKRGKVVLVCKYNFHKEKLKDLRNKKIMEEVAERFFKAKVIFDLILSEDLNSSLKNRLEKFRNSKQELNKKESNINKGLANQALNVFGGEIV